MKYNVPTSGKNLMDGTLIKQKTNVILTYMFVSLPLAWGRAP